ncbi:hypothetical protein [Calycomorphotria hydatis]|uniref:Biopolymer transport protein ExbD/TolR n=1 Tax=Calycomorphotria hydatis TaxID=2528027 RepID=A0A517TAE1_9PLAN|nr:hypothetical protein [Calycomorphotria hydatis]QDT65337.1 hypothetical protein V22_25860 [Calycomorphotria hydatis]
MIRRVQIGIFAAAVVGVAALLNGLINGFGLGEGDGSGETNKADSQQVETTKEEPSEKVTEAPKEDATAVEVLIDDRSYAMRPLGSEGTWSPTTIAEIVSRVQTLPSTGGLKVLIQRKPSARASAEEELRTELLNGGLTTEMIDVAPDFTTELEEGSR